MQIFLLKLQSQKEVLSLILCHKFSLTIVVRKTIECASRDEQFICESNSKKFQIHAPVSHFGQTASSQRGISAMF